MITDLMLNQLITTIYSTDRDGYGEITKTSMYIDVPCRWQEKFEVVLDANGQEQISAIQAWLRTDLEGTEIVILPDYIFLFLGTEYKVIIVSNHYNMLGQREYIKVYLK
jgi:hypothetical protein